MLMSRLQVAKEELAVASSEGPQAHAKVSQRNRDAAKLILEGSQWIRVQAHALVETMGEVKWFENDGIAVAGKINVQKSNNTGRMQDFPSLWSYF